MPKFSIIVPTCHRNESLARCLEKLAPNYQNFDQINYEVVVTDDGFVTTAEAMVGEHFPWVRWTAGPQRGPAANRNNGAKNAKGKYLAFTDDDCIPDVNWLSAYSEAVMEHPDCNVFEGRTYVGEKRMSLADISPINEMGNHLYSCNLFVKSDTFFRLNGFDERFTQATMEDIDFAYRVHESGETHVFVPNAAVMHPWRRAGGWKYLRMINAGVLIYLQLHPSERKNMNSFFYYKSCLAILVRDLPKAVWLLDGRGIYWTIQLALSRISLGLSVGNALK